MSEVDKKTLELFQKIAPEVVACERISFNLYKLTVLLHDSGLSKTSERLYTLAKFKLDTPIFIDRILYNEITETKKGNFWCIKNAYDMRVLVDPNGKNIMLDTKRQVNLGKGDLVH